MRSTRALPAPRIIHPEYGDITDDVKAALLELARPADPVILAREQAEMAATAGNLAREFAGGHVIAQFHPDVFDTWVRQRGIEEFTKSNELIKYLARHHPATAMKYVPAQLKLHVHRTAA